MRIDGEWRLCQDGEVRPVFSGVVEAHDASTVDVRFLADTGADHTVFSADAWKRLGFQSIDHSLRVEGVGGRAPTEIVPTEIRLTTSSGAVVKFKGQFAAVTDPSALDMSVLGRDILNVFALIVDRPNSILCLVGQGHRYEIVAT